MPSATQSLLSLFLPEFILENFEFTNVIEDPDTFHIQLEEINSLPIEWNSIKVQSKGFFQRLWFRISLFEVIKSFITSRDGAGSIWKAVR